MKETKEKLSKQQSFQERCLMMDIRMTSQRRLLASVLNESNDHPDVETIFQRCKAKDELTSIASIYRSLSLFEDSGLIEKLDMGDGKARFEIKRTDHDHLLDVETGQIHEFKSQELQRLIKEIADEMGFDLTEHRLEIYGRKQGRTACRCYEIKIY
jgi:Fur family transcriptional regulator, ferric uptake regulator